MSDEPDVLDQAVVTELRDSVGGDDGFVRELVSAYLAESPAHLDAIATAAAQGDAAAAIRPAHTLKSSSAAIGAMRLAAVSQQLELAARGGRIDQAAVDKLHSVWPATLAALGAAGMTE